MTTINLSGTDDYYSQINNRYIPISACTPTSLVMFMLAEGIPVVEAGSVVPFTQEYFRYPEGMQPEDFITVLCNSPWGDDIKATKTPWFGHDIPNQTIHAVVAEIANRVIGKKVIKFVEEKNTIYTISKQLYDRHPVMVSGDFTRSGHTVVIVGMEFKMGMIRKDIDWPIPSNFIIDDPFGDYHTGYSNTHGNDVVIDVDKFEKLWHGFAYYIDKNGV